MDIASYIGWQLNEEQKVAALHTTTSSLILAWAGSGKTRVLTYKIAYLVFGCHISPENIFAVTFTNKAAKEMKERLDHIARDVQAESGKTDWTPKQFQWIGTFHGMFLRILKRDIAKTDRGFTTDFVIYDDGETQSLLKEIIKDLKMEDDVEIREVKSVISKYKSQWINASSMMKKADSWYDQTMGMIFEKYEKKLKDNNAMDFDDLLGYSYKMFKDYPDVLAYRQEKFKYILVDEAQDTNRIQFELMKLLTAKGSNITFIWDDYQSIYRRRGAMMENFLQVKKIWPDMEIFKLQTNYRSRPHIVQAGNHIIKNNKKQYEKNVVAHREGNDRIMIFTHSSEAEEAANSIQLMQKLKDDKNKTRWDIAILYRTNAQSAPFEQLFLQEGIPYKVYGWFKFFERKEVKDILSYLKFFINPRDTVALKRIINTPKRKIWPDTVDKIEQYSKENNLVLFDVFSRLESHSIVLGAAAKAAIKQFMTSMEFLGQCLDTTAPSSFIHQIVSSIRYKDYLLESEWKDVGQEKYENIGQLINIASKFDPQQGFQVNNGKELLSQFLEEVSLLTDLEESAGKWTDSVQLMTIHASKWLEFPIVFVVGLEESIFPLGNAALDADALEEERRLMYVALTRAKDHLFLSHANSRRQRWQLKYNEASRFILELPDELVKHFDFAWWTNTSATYGPPPTNDFDVWDQVFHKLFGKWVIREVRNNMIVVQFSNPKFGLRKMDAKFVKKA
jgi:DNA helicase II / ATP-dependent DNA helicase PcrA